MQRRCNDSHNHREAVSLRTTSTSVCWEGHTHSFIAFMTISTSILSLSSSLFTWQAQPEHDFSPLPFPLSHMWTHRLQLPSQWLFVYWKSPTYLWYFDSYLDQIHRLILSLSVLFSLPSVILNTETTYRLMDSFFSSESKSVHFENQLIFQERNTKHLLYKKMWVCARFPLFHSTGNVMIYRICLRALAEKKIYILL